MPTPADPGPQNFVGDYIIVKSPADAQRLPNADHMNRPRFVGIEPEDVPLIGRRVASNDAPGLFERPIEMVRFHPSSLGAPGG